MTVSRFRRDREEKRGSVRGKGFACGYAARAARYV